METKNLKELGDDIVLKSKEKKPTHVTCGIDHGFNELLEDGIAVSGRSKKSEVAMRLKDHLLRFESITTVGIATERKTD